MQLSNQFPGSRSRTLWVWTTLLLLLAVTNTTTPGGGQVQAAESPQQQPRDLSLLNTIEELLEKLLEKLNSLLSYYVNPTTTAPDGTSNATTTPDDSTATDATTSDSTETTTPGSTTSDGTATDTGTSDSSESTTSGSTPSGATSTDISTSDSSDSTTSGSTPSGATSTDISTSDSSESTTSGSTPSGATSTDISTSDSSESSTPGSTASTGSSTDDPGKNNPGTLYLTKRSLAISRKLLVDKDANGVCTPEEGTDHCEKLLHVMDTIDDVTGRLNEGEVSEDMVNQLENATSEMDSVLEHKGEISFEDEFKDTIEDTIEDVIIAKDKVQADKDTQNNNSQTLVIVLGSVGGFIVVALVATLIFAYYKKKKTSIDDRQKLNTEYVPINSFKEDGHDNPNFYPEVVTAQRPAQPQEVKTYGTPSHLQPKSSLAQDNSNSQQNYYEAPAYSKVDDPESQNVPQRTSYRGGYATETQGQQPTYSRPAADKVPRPNVYGNTNKQPPRPVSGANYDTDHRSPSRPTSKTASDYERKPNRSGYESDVRVPPRVAPKPLSSRPNNPPARSYDDEANDPYSLVGRGNIKRMSGAPAGGLRRIDN